MLKLPYPENSAITRNGNSMQVDFSIPEDFPYLEGHFPGNPIVPAIVQIGWAKIGVENLLGARLDDYRLSRFKFILPIRPLDNIKVHLDLGRRGFTYKIFKTGLLCCSGFITPSNND